MPAVAANAAGILAGARRTFMSTITLTQVEPAFASPMMLFQVQDCEVLNRQLVEEGQAMRARSPGVTRSNREGWHSEDDFFGRTEPGCAALRAHILEAVQETTRLLSPHFDFAANRALCQGWINVNPPGAFNAPHDHSGFALSGVYYASVPPEGQQRRDRVPRPARQRQRLHDRRRRLLQSQVHHQPETGKSSGVPVLSDALGAAERGFDGPGHGRLQHPLSQAV